MLYFAKLWLYWEKLLNHSQNLYISENHIILLIDLSISSAICFKNSEGLTLYYYHFTSTLCESFFSQSDQDWLIDDLFKLWRICESFIFYWVQIYGNDIEKIIIVNFNQIFSLFFFLIRCEMLSSDSSDHGLFSRNLCFLSDKLGL